MRIDTIDSAKQSNLHAYTGKIASKCSIIGYLKSLMSRNDVKCVAFTLAEVLIVLGIIGIIAEMTIPTLMQNVQDKVTVVALKKAYSTVSQAYTMAVNENGTPDNWDLVASNSGQGAVNILNVLAPYLKITKKCDTGTGCFPAVAYQTVNGVDAINYDTSLVNGKAQLADGSLISTYSHGSCILSVGGTVALQSVCAAYEVDINGFKSPNAYGKDMFGFYITKLGIIPMGTQQETGIGFENRCIKAGADGEGCTAWVIYNENLDYLKCGSTLSWTGKTKCD